MSFPLRNTDFEISSLKQYILVIKSYFGDSEYLSYEKKILALADDPRPNYTEKSNQIISSLVGDIQAFYGDPSPTEEGEVSEAQLQENCAKYLAQLEKIVADYENKQNK